MCTIGLAQDQLLAQKTKMPNSIQVTSRSSANDIIRWQLNEDVELRISKSSGFEPGCEGLALSALRAVAKNSIRLHVVCDFPEPQSELELSTTLLATPFGISATRLAASMSFGGGGYASSLQFKALQGALYRKQQGMFGSGNYRAFICADPMFFVPPVFLARMGDTEGFPPPSALRKALHEAMSEMGFSSVLESKTEAPLLSFIYELFQNSAEHGQSSEEGLGRSTRALIVQKIVVQGGDLEARHLSPEIRGYLSRVAEEQKNRVGLGVVCITIADQGVGIQGTLPISGEFENHSPEETTEQRFIRAFKAGQSRKQSGEMQRGLGLATAIKAAFDLNALVNIWSDNLYCSQDFSTGEIRYPVLSIESVQTLPRHVSFGTTVSIFLPEFTNSPDQGQLLLA